MNPISANFFILGETGTFAIRRLPECPRVGDRVVFNDVRYDVVRVEWCLDVDATERGVRVNIEMLCRSDEA